MTFKSCTTVDCLRDSGREFHIVGPETLNTLSPIFVLVRGMIKSVVSAQHRRLHDGSWLTGVTASMMYAGDWPVCACTSEGRVWTGCSSVSAANATQWMPEWHGRQVTSRGQVMLQRSEPVAVEQLLTMAEWQAQSCSNLVCQERQPWPVTKCFIASLVMKCLICLKWQRW